MKLFDNEKYWIVEGDAALDFTVALGIEESVAAHHHIIDGPFDTHEEAVAGVDCLYDEMYLQHQMLDDMQMLKEVT